MQEEIKNYINDLDIEYNKGKSINKFISQNGKNIDLYNMDCLEGLKNFSDNHFDITVTSPPYNLGISYNMYDDTISRPDYLKWIEKVAKMIKLKLKENGSFFLNIGSSPSNPWGPFEVAMTLRSHFVLQNVIHWIKSIYIENESYGDNLSINVGHYKPIPGKRFINDNHEYIFHFTKSGNVQLDRMSIGVPYKDQGNVKRWKAGQNGIRCRGNTWYFPYKTIQFRDKERPHPATFPVEIVEKCILLHGLDNDMVILDPFMGIGNTSLACNKLGINCVGFEIDPMYYKDNIRSLKSEIYQKVL